MPRLIGSGNPPLAGNASAIEPNRAAFVAAFFVLCYNTGMDTYVLCALALSCCVVAAGATEIAITIWRHWDASETLLEALVGDLYAGR
jgi:hypothetical protein